ncbi:unnamed protein product [Periconia digitata]|uniref:Uncharacterized protein n=1 Tax=Periconia digitata TaxID=1303443 RepID=A0A9W4UJF9_9PLEO|nr:unnamed protein product [Periconia digitata]
MASSHFIHLPQRIHPLRKMHCTIHNQDHITSRATASTVARPCPQLSNLATCVSLVLSTAALSIHLQAYTNPDPITVLPVLMPPPDLAGHASLSPATSRLLRSLVTCSFHAQNIHYMSGKRNTEQASTHMSYHQGIFVSTRRAFLG